LKKVLSIFGTRPEVIKMAPVIKALETHPKIHSLVCTTSQHRQMQDQMMALFDLKADYDLDCMKPGQDLFYLTSVMLDKLKLVLTSVKPDLILVQGDTTSSFVASLSAFYLGIPVGHVEAGLRTHDLQAPFPEEGNRALIGRIAEMHFAPTKTAKQHLLEERINPQQVFVTGNTVIDALLWVRDRLDKKSLMQEFDPSVKKLLESEAPYILITGHRRESFGEAFKSICRAIQSLAKQYPKMHFIYPVHLNPNVQGPVDTFLRDIDNVHLISPLDYQPFVFLMDHCFCVLTDSGGVQEEAPSLGKPVLVMREKTERPEGIAAGTAMLVGTDKDKVVQAVSTIIEDKLLYEKMANAVNPYGDGRAAEKISDEIVNYFKCEDHSNQPVFCENS